MVRKIIILVLVMAGFLGIMGCVDAAGGAPRITVVPASYDFGEVSQSKGKVSTDFIVKNTGGAPLKFNRVSTSCGCTVAEIEQTALEAGGQRKMEVSFDPMTHSDQTGPVIRVVYLQTNDPAKPETEIEIRANVKK